MVPAMCSLSRFRVLSFTCAFLCAAAVLTACQKSDQAPTANNAADSAAVDLPIVPTPDPPLDRAALLSAIAQAASATAAGTEMPEAVRGLDGRQFELRIRFGCRGPSSDLQEKSFSFQ